MTYRSLLTVALLTTAACGGKDWECMIEGGSPKFSNQIGCEQDFSALASAPLSASIPGARSVKTVIDRVDGNALYFQNSETYQTHWEFTSDQLSGTNGLPIVPAQNDFSLTEYSSPSRRFVLGAVTHYEGPGVYAYELAPYDTADADMITEAYLEIRDNVFFGDDLYFHPTSDSIEAVAETLPSSVKVITTDELYEGIDFQPLNPGESYGLLRFTTSAALDAEFYTSFRDILVLDQVPNDISVIMGIITDEFQTPLSHVNVLSQNRGTPNMALRGAQTNPELRALEGKWVKLTVTLNDYTIQEVTREEADAWWEANKPDQVQIPGMDLSVTELTDIENAIDLDAEPLFDAIKTSTRAFGGKAAHFAALSHIESVPTPQAFAIPVYYYRQFMEDNGFDAQVEAMMADPDFLDDPAVRDQQLSALRDAMRAAPIDAALLAAVIDKINTEFPPQRMRFRSSTNAEDLDGFTGAGLYTSKSGDPNDPLYPVEDAIRDVWASLWNYRAFEERTYRSIDHNAVGMALLVHRSFPDEEMNGVALTNNPFDQTGVETPFYINVQAGGTSVVQPPAGVTSDQFIYYYERQGQPSVFIAHSSLVPQGSTVLNNAQSYELGQALYDIREFFAPAYSYSDGSWWAMDVEFKFDGEPGEEPILYVKQARPYGGR